MIIGNSWLSTLVESKLNKIIDALIELFILRGAPAFILSDNGPEFIAQVVRDWIVTMGS